MGSVWNTNTTFILKSIVEVVNGQPDTHHKQVNGPSSHNLAFERTDNSESEVLRHRRSLGVTSQSFLQLALCLLYVVVSVLIERSILFECHALLLVLGLLWRQEGVAPGGTVNECIQVGTPVHKLKAVSAVVFTQNMTHMTFR
jgi:hypothetical protein